jgi:hypothetical protein
LCNLHPTPIIRLVSEPHAAVPVPPLPVRCTRLYADPDGSPRFDHIDFELNPLDYAPPAPPVDVSAPTPASAAFFMRFPAGFTSPAHPTPVRQLALIVEGECIAVAGHESRRFVTGDVLLMEDTHGPGHETHALTATTLIIVRL